MYSLRNLLKEWPLDFYEEEEKGEEEEKYSGSKYFVSFHMKATFFP